MPPISFTRAVGYYDSTRGYPDGVAEKIRDAILTTTHAHPNTQFLEIGVGTGLIALPFIQAGCAYTGVDISREMMAELEQKLAAASTPAEQNAYRHNLVQTNVMHLPFSDHTFDVVIAVHILHLLENWQLALREVRRVLHQSGGWFIVGRHESADPESDPGRMIHTKWDEILQAIDPAHNGSRGSSWLNNGTIGAALQELGASTQSVDLVLYERAPISLRAMAERQKARMFSRDWNIPDPVHSEAVRRLDKWLDEEAPDPDKPLTTKGIFQILSAHW